MQLDELRSLIAQEPERRMVYPVYLERKPINVKQSDGVPLSEFLVNREPTGESRTIIFRHILGPPASLKAVRAWQERWPSYPLPLDLQVLVEQVNGIHLWADVEEGRAYSGLAPIEEWQPARLAMYGCDSDPELLSECYLALSYHADRGSFVVLDVDSGMYFLMDSCSPDKTCAVGASVAELLDWLWADRLPP